MNNVFMEVTHIIINNNFLYLFKKSNTCALSVEIYDIYNNLKPINKKKFNDEYFDYFMNNIYLYNDNFYILGGYLNNISRSLKFITIMSIDFKTINIIKAINYEIPESRYFLDNNNIIIKNNIIYLAGGYNNDYLYDDLWSFDLNTKKWKNIEKNIFINKKTEKIRDYIEIYDFNNNKNNIIITGKYINFYYFLYDINNNFIREINIQNNLKKELFNNNLIIYKVFNKNNTIYVILKNNNKIMCLKIENDIGELFFIANNEYNDILIDNDNNNIYITERKTTLIKNLKIYRFNNNLYDNIINFIRTKFNFTNKDYIILPNKIKTDILIHT